MQISRSKSLKEFFKRNTKYSPLVQGSSYYILNNELSVEKVYRIHKNDKDFWKLSLYDIKRDIFYKDLGTIISVIKKINELEGLTVPVKAEIYEPPSDIYVISKDINTMALAKGYWKDGIELHKKLILIISEVVEAMEADRVDNYCILNEKILSSLINEEDNLIFKVQFERYIKHTFQDEIADTAIRLFDLAYMKQVDLPLMIALKMRYNKLNKETKKKY